MASCHELITPIRSLDTRLSIGPELEEDRRLSLAFQFVSFFLVSPPIPFHFSSNMVKDWGLTKRQGLRKGNNCNNNRALKIIYGTDNKRRDK